ncbi:putative monovalent cation/H+ antiporter subunit A [Salaquimonas pukyongi]|uniref:putative monovalent cation/H+ antiporter subunit A n=1 Tax=Salaquimonas pukyongi TaxID=2712698 RepID=UPI00096BC985|nr:putative monovalent cation/H+ antiporter subunit A [Salaquimonas pukyongi]
MIEVNPTILFLLSPFLAALLSPPLFRLMGAAAAWVLALIPLAVFIHLAGYVPQVASGEAFTMGLSWAPSLGVNLSYFLDGLSLIFALLISGIGTLIILYAGGYLKGHPQHGRFVAYLFLFMGSMLGVVTADNLIALFIYWELTSITSFLLIGFDHNRMASRRAAMQALVVTGGGGLALLAGVVVLNLATGMNELSLILASGETLRESPFYLLIFWLVVAGAFTKSAQFPFHFWLPNAMEAPTPVSAYLHSATMVKAGVYLLMRMNPVLGETPVWETVLPVFGTATLLVGTLLAIRQTDLKLMLAYTTVASLGLLVMLTGFGSEKAIEAAVYYLFAHALFKGALFMVAGLIDHETGTRDIRQLGGLRSAMPITFAAAALAALSMAGLPPFVGFMAKEEIYAAIAAGDPWPLAITALTVVGNALMLVIAAAVAILPFLGKSVKTPKHAHEGPVLLWLGPVVLAVCGLVSAVLSGKTNHLIISPMSSAVAGSEVHAHAAIALHIGIPLLLSVITIALGVVLFLQLSRSRDAMAAALRGIGWGPDHGFDQFMKGLVSGSAAITRVIQNGRLEGYMTTVFFVFGAAVWFSLYTYGELPDFPQFVAPTFYEAGIFLLALLGLGAVIYAHDRLTAIVSLGIQGFSVAVIFILFGAPDLAFTQFMVETLSVVILALVMTRLTLNKTDHRPFGEKSFDITVASIAGSGFAVLMLAVLQVPFDPRLSEFFSAYSRVVAHGRNIVNVIIVDFRGLDTLGEIAVVMIAGLGIIALIRVKARQPRSEAEG